MGAVTSRAMPTAVRRVIATYYTAGRGRGSRETPGDAAGGYIRLRPDFQSGGYMSPRIGRIVVIRSHESLQEGWRKRSFGPAGPLLEDRVKIQGVRFDETYHPVQVLRRIGGGDDPPAASGFNYGGVAPAATYALRVEAEDDDAIERLRRDRQPEIVGVFADPAVSPFPSAYSGAAAIGATADVARRRGVPTLSRAGLTGSG